METRCPFLKEEKVAFCKAFPIRKMLPFDRLYLKDNLCFGKDHTQCPIYQEKEGSKVSGRKVCPFLEVEAMIYCEVYPVKKMIPSSAFRLECPCTTEAYIDCPAYQRIAQGDLPSSEDEAITVRGFLLDDTVYYHKVHIWLQRVDGKLRVGLDDFGQWLLGQIEEVTLPCQGGRVEPAHPLVRVSCAQGTAEIPSPLSGTVVGVNEGLRRDSSLINTDPYGQGWLLEVQPVKGELARLDRQAEGFFSGREARNWLEKEVDRLHCILQTEIGVTMSDGGELLRDLQEVIDPQQWGILIKTFLERKEV
ncbi:MAG: glycine cleavage system protein H [Deltaproteobacteria bacterium]|nr:glycine cleavage system protein H [Deltaproteobacteria bacterium]